MRSRIIPTNGVCPGLAAGAGAGALAVDKSAGTHEAKTNTAKPKLENRGSSRS